MSIFFNDFLISWVLVCTFIVLEKKYLKIPEKDKNCWSQKIIEDTQFYSGEKWTLPQVICNSHCSNGSPALNLELKGNHCQKTHCNNGIVDYVEHYCIQKIKSIQIQIISKWKRNRFVLKCYQDRL